MSETATRWLKMTPDREFNFKHKERYIVRMEGCNLPVVLQYYDYGFLNETGEVVWQESIEAYLPEPVPYYDLPIKRPDAGWGGSSGS